MSIFIVAIIFALLLALAGYAFITQSIEKKRVQKQRILTTLKTKQRNFVHLINGFPPNFLGSDLLALIYRALIDVCEQLNKIEPKDPRHQDDVTLYTNQLDALPKNSQAQRVRVEAPQAMKEIRQHLQELQNFLVQQEATKVINKVQFVAYVDQIKRLILQMSVDAYLYQGKQAQQIGKLRLAIHFFTLAKKLLAAENASRAYDKQIAQLDGILIKLEEKVQLSATTEPANSSDASLTKEVSGEQRPEDSWKKKQMYD
ncbi:MAG: hypothetical protein EOO53_16775 [Gammaproteobacteria bacterium]|nr:MAG: hypothetical protein EOO53_16775 [Gammaproteobacteria bacterium]